MSKVIDMSFREMYHQVCYISLGNDLIGSIEGFSKGEDADGAIVYGYIDHEAGFTFELLSLAQYEGDKGIRCFGGNNELTFKLRLGGVAESEMVVLDASGAGEYIEKIKMINDGYECSEGIAITRDIELIDESRSPEYPDDVLVYLLKENLEPEGCWVRCEGVSDSRIQGILLNEPDQDFGVHEGDIISFGIMKQDDENICVASL